MSSGTARSQKGWIQSSREGRILDVIQGFAFFPDSNGKPSMLLFFFFSKERYDQGSRLGKVRVGQSSTREGSTCYIQELLGGVSR